MIEERAVIIALSEEAQSGVSIASLEIERRTACGLCGQTRGCGNQVWGKLLGHQSTAFKAENAIQAKVGQSVIVAIDAQALVKAALLLYMTPLLGMFLLGVLANLLWHNDVAAILGALIGLFIGGLWLKGYLIANPHAMYQQPQIIRLADDHQYACTR